MGGEARGCNLSHLPGRAGAVVEAAGLAARPAHRNSESGAKICGRVCGLQLSLY
jgi:hypothetical protein